MSETLNSHTAQLICIDSTVRIVHNVKNTNKYVIWQSRLFERAHETHMYLETNKVQRIRTLEGDSDEISNN